MTEVPTSSQRIDKWLWCARFLKSRSLAADLVEEGHVRVNGRRMDGPDKPVRVGDVLTIALERRVIVARVLSLAARRGPASEAQQLYTVIE